MNNFVTYNPDLDSNCEDVGLESGFCEYSHSYVSLVSKVSM